MCLLIFLIKFGQPEVVKMTKKHQNLVKKACTRHISRTVSHRLLVLVSNESSQPVDVYFGAFYQIRPIGHGQNLPKNPKISIFVKI